MEVCREPADQGAADDTTDTTDWETLAASAGTEQHTGGKWS